MKKVTLVLVAMVAVLLSVPAYGWWGDDYGDDYYHRRDRRNHYGYGYRHRYYDQYYGYGRDYDYGYHEYYERHFGDRPLRFRFRSPDFDLDIRG